MPYDVNYDSGLAERLNKMQLPSTEVAILTSYEGTETDYTKKRFANLVYIINSAESAAEVNSAVVSGTGVVSVSGSMSTPVNGISAVDHTFQLYFPNVTVPIAYQFEGSLDGVNWFNLDATNTPSYQSVSGCVGATYNGKILESRINYLSGEGTIEFTYFAGR